jgi:cellulose synthase/poly-beta-1,6-N-acetylglucosamine synthase-like glycosyltransferase/spore germination protein YaaH/peptidoglycan/xylan/chitin deacetylase (PgdA/CDA1 family)
MANPSQIFQTNNPSRWKRIKWTGRIIFFVSLFVLAVVILAIALAKNPSTIVNSGQYSGNQLPEHHDKKIKGFKEYLAKKEADEMRARQTTSNSKTSGQFIRAAFYTPWSGSKSVPSLERYGDKINTIFPEWFFIDTNNNIQLQSRMDSAGLAQMRQRNLHIMPMLTNFNSSKKDKEGRLAPDFDGNLIHSILNDTVKQRKFIQQVVDTLLRYNFQGINIDFEEIQETSNKPLTRFQKNLYNALHEKKLLVTQDVSAMNDDYDFEQLSNYNDYVILMAYDQFSTSSGPGPISDQKWVEDAVDQAAKKMDSRKIILGLGGYGYDWASWTTKDGEIEKEVRDRTYAEAIDKARIANAAIDFDNDKYNLHYSYTEKEYDPNSPVKKHEVWFTDAATTFNIMRFADEYGLAGTAIWRMGSEDPRIWSFYNLDLDNASLQKNPFDFNLLAQTPINPNQKPSWVGQEGGEILNILGSPQAGKIKLEIDSTEQLVSEQVYTQLPSGYVYEKSGEDTSEIGPGHKIILTFDDGPSEDYTPQILTILEREKIPAAFFIVGREAEQNLAVLKRIYRDGFEIGNHTFTHNNIATMSPERADIEMKATRLLIEAVTNHSTILFRAPYNADSEPQTFEEIEPLARSKKDNYITVGESIDPNDWDARNNADSIVAKTIRLAESTSGNIILLHDAGGESRQATVDALPRIIKYFRDKGCVFTTVADLMGKTKNEVMPPVKNSLGNSFNYFFLEFIYWTGKIVFSLFLIGIFLSIGRIFLMAFLAWLQKREEKNIALLNTPFVGQPLVSIIVPAYNEEINATRTVQSLLKQDYPNMQVIFVDDGSKDNTFKVVQDAFYGNNNVKVFTKPNGGKASALNVGIEKAEGEFVVCIDADTQLKTDAVSQLIKKFTDETVGAVAGNVKVGNEINMITRWQSIEYITSQNFDRRAFAYLNCITVIPGAIGAFKKEAVIKGGGFTSDTLAEDCDLTMRLHRIGYSIGNCTDAISYTEAPETMKQFMKQRFRWSFGVMQCFWKHRDAVFNPRYKNFGMIAMPHILVFQMILPFLAPLADLVLVFSLIVGAFNIIPISAGHIALFYVLFSLVDVAGAALAFAYEKEDYKKLLWMIPQRLIYRQLMYYILFKSFNKALKGELQGWGILKRTGNVKKTDELKVAGAD